MLEVGDALVGGCRTAASSIIPLYGGRSGGVSQFTRIFKGTYPPMKSGLAVPRCESPPKIRFPQVPKYFKPQRGSRSGGPSFKNCLGAPRNFFVRAGGLEETLNFNPPRLVGPLPKPPRRRAGGEEKIGPFGGSRLARGAPGTGGKGPRQKGAPREGPTGFKPPPPISGRQKTRGNGGRGGGP